MLHVGNDIVDLCTDGARGKAKDSRFVNRILTLDEKQFLFSRPESSDALLWVFWAAKETAFKAVNKSFPKISSAPRRYAVTLDSEIFRSKMSGSVKTPKGSVAISVFTDENHVHCIGTTGDQNHLGNIFFGTKMIGFGTDRFLSSEQQSFQVRKLAKQKIARVLNMDAKDIGFAQKGKNEISGPPVIYVGSQKSGMDISLSHHGRFIAFAFEGLTKGVKN